MGWKKWVVLYSVAGAVVAARYRKTAEPVSTALFWPLLVDWAWLQRTASGALIAPPPDRQFNRVVGLLARLTASVGSDSPELEMRLHDARCWLAQHSMEVNGNDGGWMDKSETKTEGVDDASEA